ncbi:MAG: glycosyltransferase [Actinomycetota bacterium]|nr:glycosyltransferase [Actinomycetota bacterium]
MHLYPSYIGSKIKTGLPLWADLFGHVMAEAQARAAVDEDDGCLFHYWNSEYNILRKADLFSCVSERQEYALIGELGAAGRLNRHTLGYDFSCCIPCGMPADSYQHTRKVIRTAEGVGEDDFVVLWTGGYNTWTDVDTLFEGLKLAMESNPKIKFVSTGGEIPEQDTRTYPHFLSLIEESRFRQNFLMKGWIKGEDVPNYYLEADVGINIDKDIYEVRLGSKNRILDWMRAGLCVVSSDVCELTHIIEKEGIGYTFTPGSSQQLAKLLLYLADHRQQVKERGQEGRQYGLKHFNYAYTTRDLRQWAKKPYTAPDRSQDKKIMFQKEEALNNMEGIAARQKEMIADRDARIAELEAIVKKGFIYRSYAYLKMLAKKVRG